MRKKKAGIPTPDYLANVALYYLGRFAASEASLRRVLENRLRRAAMAHPDFAADHARQTELKQDIAKIIEQHKKTGAINDEAFAAMKAGSLRRSGRSARSIAEKLRQKGIAPALIEKALEPEDGATREDEELVAARSFAKRRGLGPYRRISATPHSDAPEKLKRKETAALARAGFGFNVIKNVLGGEAEWGEE